MVIYGFGSISGGPILGWINDKRGGDISVSKASIPLNLIIYGSMLLCNEIHQFNAICFISGFLVGAADSSQMTQISIMIAKHFPK
jgi:MFS family permease